MSAAENQEAAVTPDDVQTPAALMSFLSLLDKQVAAVAAQQTDIVVPVGVRARGLTWAMYRMAEMLERQEARIAALELSTVKATKVEYD